MSITTQLHRTTISATPLQIRHALRALADLLQRPELKPKDRISVESLIARLQQAQADLERRS